MCGCACCLNTPTDIVLDEGKVKGSLTVGWCYCCCRALGAAGVKSLLAVPISFVSEHIETLEEIDMEYRCEPIAHSSARGH